MSDFIPSAIVPFILTSLIIELTPGPNMAWLAMLSIAEGKRPGFLAVIGIGLGLLSIGLAAAFGLAAMITASPAIYEGLRWGGVLFLLYLAWEGFFSQNETSPGHSGALKYFSRGFIINLLNPKAAVFFIAILPSFIDPAAPALGQAISLTGINVAIATSIHLLIVALAGSLRPWINDDAKRQIVRRILSLLLVVVAVWFALKTAL